MVLLGFLKKAVRGNFFILARANRLIRMTRCVMLRDTTVATVTVALPGHFVYA